MRTIHSHPQARVAGLIALYPRRQANAAALILIALDGLDDVAEFTAMLVAATNGSARLSAVNGLVVQRHFVRFGVSS